MLFWLNAQLPQVITNYKAGSTEGLSLNFLAIWLAGDSTNLVGSLLTHQLPFQIYLGTYFVFIDLCLLAQWMYYKNKNKQDEYVIIPSSTSTTVVAVDDYYSYTDSFNNRSSLLSLQHPAYRNIPVHHYHYVPSPNNTASTVNYTATESTPFSSSASPSKWYTLSITPANITKEDTKDSDLDSTNNSIKTTATVHNHSNATKLLSILFFSSFYFIPQSNIITTTTDTVISSSSSHSLSITSAVDQDTILWIGRVIAWTCTCLYLTSRIPQLLKNYYRQSVEGLSISLFIFAALGNLTYASSILLHPQQTTAILLEALPFLIGSVGTLIFDLSIFCQFIWYILQKKKRESHRLRNKQINENAV
ncbi:PQ loop repeat-domain-containing protein [Mycotypha africana]|uniref:PQ loop repeat-domain-containing protein n=1 Tax=Mycotypha africana TaxID=64632 RepID=UPI00230185B1|nr:PQ loop repeat-domain-containing protein [Mycotypha africana]KAI8988258.1 PQ loop repeat-domain-containing protein [Mycotypha africana]